MEQTDALRLVYLSACLAGQSRTGHFSCGETATAATGHPRGHRHAVAVSGAGAMAFADMFYRELLTGPCAPRRWMRPWATPAAVSMPEPGRLQLRHPIALAQCSGRRRLPTGRIARPKRNADKRARPHAR
ncbi:MAG: hypothetical protein R2838_19540 [Caldilineaceae bacterium]